MPSDRAGSLEALSQAAMGSGQIVASLVQVHLHGQPLCLFRESHRLAGESTVLMPKVQIVPLDVHRLDFMKRNVSKNRPFEHRDHTSVFVPLLDHLAISQGGTSHDFRFPRLSSLAGSGKYLYRVVAREKGGSVSIQSVTDPQWRSVLAKPRFSVRHQGVSQRRLGLI